MVIKYIIAYLFVGQIYHVLQSIFYCKEHRMKYQIRDMFTTEEIGIFGWVFKITLWPLHILIEIIARLELAWPKIWTFELFNFGKKENEKTI